MYSVYSDNGGLCWVFCNNWVEFLFTPSLFVNDGNV